MIESNRFSKITGLSLLIFLAICLAFLYRPNLNITQAQTNSSQDSDYDGLTDQVEKEIYHTDPFKADTDADGYLDSTEVLIGSDPLNPHDPADSLVGATPLTSNTSDKAKTTSQINSLPWYTTRAAGLVAYLLMFLVIMLGTGMTTSYIYRYINPVQAWVIHKYLSLALGISILTHIIALSLDKYVNFGWFNILVPFASHYKTLFLSAGILGFYVLIIVIFTSLFFRLKHKKTWRGIHYAVYPLFIFSFIHGTFIGTDSQAIGVRIVYLLTGLIFFGLIIYRFIIRALKIGIKNQA